MVNESKSMEWNISEYYMVKDAKLALYIPKYRLGYKTPILNPTTCRRFRRQMLLVPLQQFIHIILLLGLKRVASYISISSRFLCFFYIHEYSRHPTHLSTCFCACVPRQRAYSSCLNRMAGPGVRP